jgi:hypothetical protein
MVLRCDAADPQSTRVASATGSTDIGFGFAFAAAKSNRRRDAGGSILNSPKSWLQALAPLMGDLIGDVRRLPIPGFPVHR